MGLYNSCMYHAAWATFFPVKRKRSRSRNRAASAAQRKFAADVALG